MMVDTYGDDICEHIKIRGNIPVIVFLKIKNIISSPFFDCTQSIFEVFHFFFLPDFIALALGFLVSIINNGISRFIN